ncbi:MAG: hypothetical protein GEV28_11200 [Actinophytocola sp.]|uniref:ribbon-helix-helix protein, CopG family n=1 Tax=Actinophytocola sp. TaxID=1872138 RepID=UPI00132BA187|nr:ribbon-helix-helix protein, CopG family [Actinophytocola sp.]MPZ80923.1 hypothetical protein [Actinophytocola sp.]
MSGSRPDVDDARQSRPRTEPKRINVAISPDMVRALEDVIRREGVSLTEALRRLVGYGDFVYRAVKEGGERLTVTGPDGTREVVLL